MFVSLNMFKGYKYRIYPTDEQQNQIIQTFGQSRWIYNYFLKMTEDLYKEGRKMPSLFDCNKMIPALKEQYPWLKIGDSKAQQLAVTNLYDAYKRFFNHQSRHPKFKKKHKSRWSYRTDGKGIIVVDNVVHLPKLGSVKIVLHRPLPAKCKIKSATVSMNHIGKFYCTLLVETPDKQVKPLQQIDASKVLVLDYSSPHFYVDNLNRSPEEAHYLRKMEKKLRHEQRKLSRICRAAKAEKRPFYASKNFCKQKSKVARIHEKIANQRLNYTNQLSAAIAKQYDAIVVEDINLKGIAGSLKLGKATNDNGFCMFRTQLSYKLADRGKYLIKVDRFFPSSQICHECGCQAPITKDLKVREWKCPHCGAHLLRDQNAAINLKFEGIRILETKGVTVQ